MCITSFILRVYLVLAESEIEKQFSSQIDLHCGFFKVSVNIRTFISLQMFMCPGRNVFVGFTYITGVTASTEKLINYILHKTMWDLIFSWKKRCQFKRAEDDLDIGAFLTKLLIQFL